MSNINYLVSIIIPTYTRPKNLERAIQSCINQDYKNIEIIVVDDNGLGTPYQIETQNLLQHYIDNRQITYVPHVRNKNGSAARNTGLKISKGEFINFLDDDDIMPNNKISAQVKTLLDNSKYGATYTDTNIIKGHRIQRITNPSETKSVDLILCGKCFFNTSTVLFRRKVLIKLNGFDESFRRHQDYELYVRFFRNDIMIKCSCSPLLKYETPNIVSNNPKKALEYLEIFLNKFKSDIRESPLRHQIYYYQYNSVLSTALLNKDYHTSAYCFKQVWKNKAPSLKMLLKYSYYFIFSYLNKEKE